MEEQQIQNFVHRVSHDELYRKELERDPEAVIGHEGFTPRVAGILTRLIPLLRAQAAGVAAMPLCIGDWWAC